MLDGRNISDEIPLPYRQARKAVTTARFQQKVAREWDVPVEPGSRLLNSKIFLEISVPVRTALDAPCLIGLQRFGRKVFDSLASLDCLGASLRNHGYLPLTATYKATSLPTLE